MKSEKNLEGLVFRQAFLEDMEKLVETRILVLRAANKLSAHADMGRVEAESRKYFKEGFEKENFLAYFVEDGEKIVGTGGVSFFKVMPTYHNPTGEKAYIMNMYTHPEYRRRGIGKKTLDILISRIRERGIKSITLEATEMGKALYLKYGFTNMSDEMELQNKGAAGPE